MHDSDTGVNYSTYLSIVTTQTNRDSHFYVYTARSRWLIKLVFIFPLQLYFLNVPHLFCLLHFSKCPSFSVSQPTQSHTSIQLSWLGTFILRYTFTPVFYVIVSKHAATSKYRYKSIGGLSNCFSQIITVFHTLGMKYYFMPNIMVL